MSVLPFGGWGAGPTRLSWECASGRAACGPARVFGPPSGVAAPGGGSALLPAGGRRKALERARLLSEMGDGVAEDLFEGEPLGDQLVHPAPDGGAAERAAADVLGQPGDEAQLGGEHGPAEVALDEEDVGELLLGGVGEHGVECADLHLQLARAL